MVVVRPVVIGEHSLAQRRLCLSVIRGRILRLVEPPQKNLHLLDGLEIAGVLTYGDSVQVGLPSSVGITGLLKGLAQLSVGGSVFGFEANGGPIAFGRVIESLGLQILVS